MKKGSFYLLCLLIFIAASCQTPQAEQIGRYNNRPITELPCISNGDGTCYRDGELFNTVNMICGDASDFDKIQTHLERMEFYRWRCKKYGRCKN